MITADTTMEMGAGQRFAPRPHLHVKTDYEGHPYATVPCEWMWDLVEYLSFHRLNLNYHFEKDCFRVVFLCRTAHAAQALLDDWAEVENETRRREEAQGE